MAIDQREALIAAVRAQVEKEKAAKAAKLKKEQEAMQLSGKSASSAKGTDDKPKYKTLSAEDLAKIEEKKRRKQAAELGIVLDDEPAQTPANETPKADDVKKDADKSEAAKKEPEKVEAEKKEPEKTDVAKKEPEKTETAKKADDKPIEAKNTESKAADSSSIGLSVGVQPDKTGKSLGTSGLGSGGLGLGGLGSKSDNSEKKSGLGLNINLGGDKKESKVDVKPEVSQDIKNETKKQETKFSFAGVKTDTNESKAEKKEEKPTPQKSYINEEKAKLQPTKIVGGNNDVKIISYGRDEKIDDAVTFSKEGNTTIISDGVTWQETPESVAKTKSDSKSDDIINIVPNRTTPTNDVKSMYDIDDEDDDLLGAEISKLANFSDDNTKNTAKSETDKKLDAEADKKKAEEEAAKKKAEEEAKKKAEIEEARKKAMAEEAKKKAEAEAAKKKAANEEAIKKAEAQKQKLREAEKKAEEQQRRIAEAAAKARAEEAARKRAEEAEARRVAEEAKRKALEEERKKAAEAARKKAEEEARAKAKQEALKVAEEARKKAEEAAKILEEAKKAEEQAAKLAEENRKKAEEEAKRKAEEEAKKKAEEEAKRKAEEEAKKKAEEEAKRKAEEEAKKRAEEDARRKAEEEAKRKAEEEAKRKAEEARKKAEEAMRILEEAKKAEEAALKAAEEARKQAEEEAKKAAEEAKKRKAEDEARKKAEEEAKRKAEEEAKKKAEEEAKKEAAAALAKKAEEEARKKAEEEAKKAEEEARKKAEEARKILEEAKKAEEEALKAAKDAESMKLDLTKPATDGKLPLAAYYLEKYTTVESISQDIINTFNAVTKEDKDKRNVIFMGEHGFGLTCLGEDFARSLYDMGVCGAKTIAKIKAAALNKVKLADAMVKLKNGCLVVENAGLISIDKFKELMDLTSAAKNEVVVILTGEKGSVERLMEAASDVASRFNHKVNVSGLSNGDMIAIAKGYISQRGFKAEDSVDGAIRNLLLAMESGNIDRMLKTVDDAMLKCEDREKSKAMEGKKYLLAEDFK